MIRATTPTQQFTFPDNWYDEYSNILITYQQKGEVVHEIKKSDLGQVDNQPKIAIYKFSQEDTLKFDADILVKVQVRVTKGTGTDVEAYASSIFEFSVTDVLNDEVL